MPSWHPVNYTIEGIKFVDQVQGVPEKVVHKEFFNVPYISPPMIV